MTDTHEAALVIYLIMIFTGHMESAPAATDIFGPASVYSKSLNRLIGLEWIYK